MVMTMTTRRAPLRPIKLSRREHAKSVHGGNRNHIKSI
jgi:hypothetical protein